MKLKIRLDTRTEALRLVQIASGLEDEDIYLVDGKGKLCVHAKSMMGVLYSMEFTDLWIESANNHYYAFSSFAID